jgi:hypothetical protein
MLIITFERARTPKQINNRQNNIMKVTKKILQNESFRKLNFSRISKETKLSRSAIYQYYQNTEEVLANILVIEFQNLNNELKKHHPRQLDNVCTILFDSIKNRVVLLKLLSLNFSIIEDSISNAMFLKLKKQIFLFMSIVKKMLIQSVPFTIDDTQLSEIQYSLLTVMCSIYPVTHDDGNHLALLKRINSNFEKPHYETLLQYNIENIIKSVSVDS